MSDLPTVVYDYWDGPYTFQLWSDGQLVVLRKQGNETTNRDLPWYTKKENGAPWIPAKRRSFVSLVKQMIREGDIEEAFRRTNTTPTTERSEP